MHYTLFISLSHENCFEKMITYLIKILSTLTRSAFVICTVLRYWLG